MIRNPVHQMPLLDQQAADRASTNPSSPWVQARDVGIAGLVLFLGLASWVLPERKWPKLARRLAARRLRSSPGLSKEELATFRVVVGDQSTSWIEQTFRQDWLGHKYHSWMQLLSCYRPRAWRPRPKLIGHHHLDAALAKGRGVVLFTANFAYQDLMAKAALASAGYQLNYLARDSHGFFESLICRRLFNGIYTSIEQRFLNERMVFSGNQTKSVNGMIKAKLRDNQPVMVLVTPLGRRVTALPFLFGRIRIATGALNFACETGAAVLPVFTIRKPDGTVETVVEPPLNRPENRSRSETIDAMLHDYVPRLEMYVAQHPDQFSFPSSNQHGEALIEPWLPPARQHRRNTAAHRQPVPELV